MSPLALCPGGTARIPLFIGTVAMVNKGRTRESKDPPNPSFDHDVYEKTEGYRASDISSFCHIVENARVTGSGGIRRGAEKKDVKMKVYGTMLLKTNCRKIQHSRFATIS